VVEEVSGAPPAQARERRQLARFDEAPFERHLVTVKSDG
jgi:hypothetical protein